MSTLRGAIAAPRLTAMLERQAENNPVFAFSKILDAPNVRAIIVPSSLVESLFFDISENERHELYRRSGMLFDSTAANPSTSLSTRA